jgi:hypothetical protein
MHALAYAWRETKAVAKNTADAVSPQHTKRFILAPPSGRDLDCNSAGPWGPDQDRDVSGVITLAHGDPALSFL